MRSPEDFPADIEATAIHLSASFYGHSQVEAIARALMERDRAATERAAKIAEEWPMFPFGQQIAAAIRSQP
jgi:hypothetical protein